MSILVFWLLAAIAAVPIALPLLPGSRSAGSAAAAEQEIESAVRRLRQARRKAGPRCPACGEACQAGDRYCGGCGGDLAQAAGGAAQAGDVLLCPFCQAPLRDTDRFCSQCARPVPGKEAK